MEFRERFYQLHRGRGISREELVHTMGVSRQAVQKWEAEVATPDLGNLPALVDYSVVSLDYSVRGTELEKPATPFPQQAVIQNYYTGQSYGFRSRRTLLGLPLVHTNLWDRGFCRAKGIIVIGNVVTGFLTIGGFSAGLSSIGDLGVGLLTLGGLAAGIAAAGGLAAGLLLALGGGAFSLGLALGGCAISQSVAIGGAAMGQYAAGGVVPGSTLAAGQDVQPSFDGLALTLDQLRAYGGNIEALSQMIHTRLPKAPERVVRLFLCVCP